MGELPVWNHKYEELLNSVSHGLFVPISIYITNILVKQSIRLQDKLRLIGNIIFGCSMTLTFSISSLYHGVRMTEVKRILRILDHCSIFFLISGTYTSFSFAVYRNLSAYILLGFLWICTLIGTILKIFFFDMIYGSYVYLGMGWSGILLVKSTLKLFPKSPLIMLIIGGLFYSLGCYFFKIGDNVMFMHFVFHIFVILGATFHSLSISTLNKIEMQKRKDKND